MRDPEVVEGPTRPICPPSDPVSCLPHPRDVVPAPLPYQDITHRTRSAHCAARHARLHARTFASPFADDRRTNDATCGPRAWLTGSLHEGGVRSVHSPLRRAPLLATPIATPLLMINSPGSFQNDLQRGDSRKAIRHRKILLYTTQNRKSLLYVLAS